MLRYVFACAVAMLSLACGGDDGTAVPLLPADYASHFVEVRDCRRSADHDLNFVRILADADAAAVYQARTGTFPEGSIVVKEEHDFADDTCAGPIVGWTVMVAVAAGSAPGKLDWQWQRLDETRRDQTEDERRCISCHTSCGQPPDGFLGTCAHP
jgi:hypothetical protein